MDKIIEFINSVDYIKLSNDLYKDGVCVVPVLTNKELKCYYSMFYKELKHFPEYNQSDNILYVLGAFGALGNPSSFHNKTMRTLRIRLMFSIIPLLSKYLNNIKDKNSYFLEQLIDRMSIRKKGTKLSKESWHRDISTNIENDDIIFGGWINLDLKNTQKFSCVKGTQIINEKEMKKGFAKIDKKEHSNLNKNKSIIEIPPGHQIIFYQNIIHEVLSIKQETESIRLYSGWRLTKYKSSLTKDLLLRLNNQSIIPLPSGQLPPLYSMNHLSLFRDQTIKWSKETFPEKLLERKVGVKTIKTIKDKAEKIKIKYEIIPRFMKSLKEMKLSLYPLYSKTELSIYIPNSDWELLLYNKELKLKLH